MIKTAKIKSVIEAQDEKGVHYFSLEGVYLGTLGQDKKVEVKKDVLVGAVAKPKTPEEVRLERERENDKLLSVEGVLSKHKSA